MLWQVGYGYASLKDVRSVNSGKFDRMESFFIAETMKYMYLLHDPDQGAFGNGGCGCGVVEVLLLLLFSFGLLFVRTSSAFRGCICCVFFS